MPPLWRFLLPSSFGLCLCLFLLPVEVDGKSTIILGVLTDLVKFLNWLRIFADETAVTGGNSRICDNCLL
ncbi:MAG: hypothetical protein ABJ308_17930 [Halieaceae bacterium]